jgi:hypothetical protein
MNLFIKNITFFYVLFFSLTFNTQNALADTNRNIVWRVEATINDEPIELFYYGSNFSALDFNWQLIENEKKRYFVPDQKWTDDNKNFFLSQDSVIDFNKIDPIIQSNKNYDKFYFPEVLLRKDGYINLKNEDKIIVKRIIANIDGEIVFLSKEDFERVKKSYHGRFQILAKNNMEMHEQIRVFLFLNIDKKYLPDEVLKIIRIEGKKILKQVKIEKDQFPKQEFTIEYNLIKNNFEYFKAVLFDKYGILLIDYVNGRC